MKLSKRIMNDIKGTPRMQKAVAIALCLKFRCGRSSTISNYNPNKIHDLIGISPITFNKYLPLMFEMGLVELQGKNKQHLVVCAMHSRHNERNVVIDRFDFKSFKGVYDSLRAYIIMSIQRHKDFIRRTLQTAHEPKNIKEFKKARRIVKRLVRNGILNSPQTTFIDNGISYKRFAKELGNCIRTAQRVVNYAINRKWLNKTTHYEYLFMRGINYAPVYGYMFTTRNYGFKIKANTYDVRPCVAANIGW